MLSIARLNDKYAFNKSAIYSRRFEDLESYQINQKIIEIRKDPALNSLESLESLKIKLFEVSLYSRSALWTEESSSFFWREKRENIIGEQKRVAHLLERKTLEAIDFLTSNLISLGVESSGKRSREIEDLISNSYKRYVIVSPRSSIASVASEWLHQKGFSERATALRTMRELANISRDNFDSVIYLGTCSSFLSREKWDRYLRVLIFGGVSPKHVFVTPDWQHETSKQSLLSRLIPGLDVPIDVDWKIEIEPSRSIVENQEDIADSVAQIDLALDSPPQISSAESLRAGGSIECKIVRLTDGLIYPVEADSDRLTVMEIVPGGNLKTVNRKLSMLQSGDIIIARWDSSESHALREHAIRSLGIVADSVIRSQNSWKSKIREITESGNLNGLKSRLRARGVIHFDRVSFWSESLAIGPQKNTDFVHLLQEFGYSESEIDQHIYCKSQLMRSLIKSGQQARESILDLLTPENLYTLSSRHPVVVKVEALGDAEYLLAPFESVDESVTKCQAMQVRRVSKGI